MAVDNHPTHIDLPPSLVSPNETQKGTPVSDYERPMSPLHMPPGQIDGLDALKAQEYMNGRRGSAFSAMHYLPYPAIVLNGSKTVVLANEATARLLSVNDGEIEEEEEEEDQQPAERYKGQTLAQLGIDMMSDLKPVWVTWDMFLDSLGDEINVHANAQEMVSSECEGDVTPTAERADPQNRFTMDAEKKTSMVHDAVVEVVITAGSITASTFAGRTAKKMADRHSYAKMIISIFEIEDEKYFLLTFTSTETAQSKIPSPKRSSRKIHNPKFGLSSSNGSKSSSSLSHSTPSSASSEHGSNHDSSQGSSGSSAITSPTNAPMSSSPFPPLGPPSRVNKSGAPSILQKVIVLKDALLDNTEVPILAMWKDESLTIPNKAARRLFAREADMSNVKNGFDLVQKWHCYNHDFTEALDPAEYPISILVRTQTPFSSRLLGLYDPDTGNKILYDCLGEAVRDPDTGEFLAGIVTCRDITAVTQQIAEIKEADEQRFQIICDSMPQLIWTTTPDGMHDWFSQRWYDYTGLTVEESLGEGWKLPFHPEDMALTKKRWLHCLETGDPYTTEYRCRKYDGEWRWMLGRAVCMRNKDTGKIEKWYGTCTDIHEAVMSRFEAKRLRQQLLSVITHAQVTLFSVDRHRKINLLEGSFIWDLDSDVGSSDESVTGSDGIEQKFVPVLGKKDGGGHINEAFIDGVIGLSMDITEIKDRENDLQMQERENTRLLANEAAAKEASRLKSQFLANMSHEIRTPIAGVIGMAELLTDMNLDEEQQECAENIQRSANALLTVINDILDFSKVESGRLDIEEVQFSLSVVVRDVSKMLGFAAERKNLMFESNIAVGVERDLIVMGDPGRVRQIITNLLTNSIKFTMKFVVEDSGIGIEEEVRKRLFKPFSQADSSTARRFGGTGLGLTIKSLWNPLWDRVQRRLSGSHSTKPQYHEGNVLIDIGSLPDRLQSEMSVSCGSSDYDVGPSPQKNAWELSKHHRSVSMTPPVVSELDMSSADRANVKVLVVEDNAINQQIALKTIRKLGFSPSAVWNGKEALDYLLAADSPNPPHPKPDIILMDVQVNANHRRISRHAYITPSSPYRYSTCDIPIVAMTASAIQGDREKCQKAGMDDYLAKPVKGKHWRKCEVDDEGSDCAEVDNENCAKRSAKSKFDRRASTSTARNRSSKSIEKGEKHVLRSPTSLQAPKKTYQSHSQTSRPEVDSKPVDTTKQSKDSARSLLEHPRPTQSERNNSHRLTLPQPEDEGERAARREGFEEKAKELRDEKLVSAAGDEHGDIHIHGHGHGEPIGLG
ncbi:histidine kinase hhk6p [Botrytis cinerea]